MNVHEYQAKALLREFGVAVPNGRLATTPEEAERAARALGSPVVVVKAQVHAGGRGKAGGIKVAKSPAEAKQAASEILGMTLHTPQTGARGQARAQGLRRGRLEHRAELYLAVAVRPRRRRSSRSSPRPRAAWRSRRSPSARRRRS